MSQAFLRCHIPRAIPTIRRRSRFPDRPYSQTSHLASDDFYALLLASPLDHPTTSHLGNNKESKPKSQKSGVSPDDTASHGAVPPISFTTPLEGPSPKLRGLARGEKGLERPSEPDNCCMSGCVNCVWDAYREEVEEWAASRQRSKLMQSHADVEYIGSDARGEEARARRAKRAILAQDPSLNSGAGTDDLDEVGGLRDYDGYSHDSDEDTLFEGIPVGIREFMNTEKRIRQQKERAGSKEQPS